MIEKIASSAVSTPSRAKTSKFSPAPSVEKSGQATMRLGTTATPGSVHSVPPPMRFTAIATTVVRRMPRSSALRTRSASKRTVTARPATATATVGLVSGPSVRGTPAPGFTMPPLTSPMKRMKSPIPTEIACFCESGIAFITASRSPLSTRIVIASPSSTTTPIAVGHGSL